MTDRAVSEALGYVLVFSIIVVTIGIVYASGISGLVGAKDVEQTENMVRAFDILGDNLDDLHRRGTPTRATEVKLTGGSIGVGESVDLKIYVEDADNSSHNNSFSISPEPIVYEQDNTEIVYVAGAVIRSDGAASAMRSEPTFTVDEDRAVVPFLMTYHSGEIRSIGGTSTVLLVGRRFSSGLAGDAEDGFADFTSENEGSDVVVNVTVDSPRAGAWQQYFEGEEYGEVDADASDDTVTYQFTTKRLIVPQTTIELELRR